MIKILLSVLLTGVSLVPFHACLAAEEWEPSRLSGGAIQQINAATVGYRQCLEQAVREQFGGSEDSRAITERILRRCEDRLKPVRQTFDHERVPSAIADRYLRMKRTQAARDVLRTVLSTQAAQPRN
jgi:hypothetical protein